ncbi:hypothetical protein BpHYR1_044451 [Brachionus plicatilis]|uniref:Uncharacterized protein n=1 Tax=Brachionus plicatilis TaxID=10195 RepID=A0A3M7QRM8_BRAPC|nr:hypothetical protein BpHYR1_044451 [Brachionus plicatilis]
MHRLNWRTVGHHAAFGRGTGRVGVVMQMMRPLLGVFEHESGVEQRKGLGVHAFVRVHSGRLEF